MKIKRLKSILFIVIIVLTFIFIIYNIYLLYSNNEKYLLNSKYADIVKRLDASEKSYFGTRTDSIFNNIETGIIWIRSSNDCNACVESQGIILEELNKFSNIKFYLYFAGYDYRTQHILAINLGYENNLIEAVDNIDKYFKHSPLLIFIYKKKIIMSNIGYKETQDRTLAFSEAIKRFIRN